MNLVCEVCDQEIAKVGYVKSPIQGSMFEGIAPHLPNPFQPMQMWDHMKCPHCNYRPFFKHGMVKTTLGMMKYDKNGPLDIVMANAIDPKLIEKEFNNYEPELPGNRQHEPQPPNYPPHTSDDSAPDPVPMGNNPTFGSAVPAPEPVEPEHADVPEQSSEAEGSEADPAPVDVVEPEPALVGTMTVDEQFEGMIGSVIVQSGSWFGYGSKNYRRQDLIKVLIDEKKILV